MPFVGSIIPPASGNPEQHDRMVKRRRREDLRAAPPGREPARRADEAELVTANEAEGAEGLHRVAPNQDQESSKDRKEHGYYRPGGGRTGSDEGGGKLDIKG